MSYSTGTIGFVCGGMIIEGVGTKFLANVKADDVLGIYGIGLPFKIAAVIDDTHLRMTNALPGRAGNSISNLAYIISTNFTPNINLPLPGGDMVDVQGTINRAWIILDKEMPASVKGLISS